MKIFRQHHFPQGRFVVACSIAALLIPAAATRAASGTWLNTGTTSALWSTPSNWVAGSVAGSTSGPNNDFATFQTAVGTYGTAANPILIDANRHIGAINFTGAAGNYVIGTAGGNSLGLSSGIRFLTGPTGLTATNAIETINAPIVLNRTAAPFFFDFTNNSASGSGAGAGTLVLGGSITATAGSTALLLQGSNTNANTISGTIGNGTATSVSLTKSGAGTWLLSGPNTFTGNVQINSGTLSVASVANTGAASALGAGNEIALGGTGSNNAKLQFTGASGGSSNRTISLFPSGLSGGGTIENTVAGQTLRLSGNVISNSIPVVNSSLALTGAGDGVLSGTISNQVGRVSTIKSGAGTWTFSGPNSYSGDTTIGDGTLQIGNSRALGSGGAQTTATGTSTIQSGATLELNGTIGINEPIILNGAGVGGNGALVNNSGTIASIGNGVAGLAVPVTGLGSGLSSAPSVVMNGTGGGATATASLGLTTASIVSATGGSGFVTGDTVSVFGGSSGSGAIGTITASGGVITSITITTAGRGFTAAPTSMAVLNSATGFFPTGVMPITGNATNFTVGGLTVTNAGAGYRTTPTVEIGGSPAAVAATLSSVHLATDSSIGGSGNITVDAVVSGAGLTKVGAGTLTLNATNTYTGDTIIRAGTLGLGANGSISNSANVIVGDAGSTGARLDATIKNGGLRIGLGQTLGGSGQIDGALTLQGGVLAPGNSAGTLNCGNLLFSGGIFAVEIASAILADQMNVLGTAGLRADTALDLTLLNSFDPMRDESWVLVNNDGSDPFEAGAFRFTSNGALIEDNMPFTVRGESYLLRYNGGTGNDVILASVGAIPEPGTAAWGLAVGLFALGRRRRS